MIPLKINNKVYLSLIKEEIKISVLMKNFGVKSIKNT